MPKKRKSKEQLVLAIKLTLEGEITISAYDVEHAIDLITQMSLKQMVRKTEVSNWKLKLNGKSV